MIKQVSIGNTGCIQIVSGNGNIVSGGNCNTGGKGVTGNGRITTILREIEAASQIIINGPISFTFAVASGEPPTAAIEADENIVPLVETNVRAGILTIDLRGSVCTENPIKVGVTMPSSIESCISYGSGRVELRDIETPAFKIELNGSGKITAKGKADTVNLTVSGSGDIKACKLAAKKANVSINGSGDIKLTVTGEVVAQICGSGDIEISGDPARRNCNIVGSGSIEFD